MSTTSPIRKEEDLQRFRNYYLEKGKMRNYLLIVVGLNTALRIGDVLSLQWKDVYDYKRRRFRAHLQVVEQKTGKTNQIALNDCVLHALRQCYNGQKADEYLFIVHVIKISRSAAVKLGELCGRQQRRQG
ncbi:tyrosine-type recombinase/integrase [Clostridium sp. AM49-4BH]|uniref:tyrosine-type recombinase/integrase n=1 Tax=Clostridium sp. AM49-4BH TaxID=2293035 RepID=UPI0026B96BA0